MENPYLPLTRNDGTTLYILRDIAYNIYKEDKAKDRNIIVLGEDQKLYYQQLSVILSLIGHKAPEVVHYSFILLPSGKMSTRRGEVVLLEDFMGEMKLKAREEILKRHGRIKNIDRLSEIISQAAIKFSIIKVSSDKNITFEIDKALSFEGDSGPYIQYAYARASSIVRKSGIKDINYKYLGLTNDHELRLLFKIYSFKEVVNKAVISLQPHIIANYSLELAKLFNEFYHECPVLSQEKEVMFSRLMLVNAVRQVIKNSLFLLGIETPKSM